MLKILHISDFHYKDSHCEDYTDMAEKICNHIKGKEINLIVFSGDLVFDVKGVEKLSKAAECLFKPLLEITKLSRSRLLIAPGNHDMKRNEEMEMVSNTINKIETTVDLNRFCQDRKQFNCSLDNSKNYNQFISEFYDKEMNITPLYTYNIFIHNGFKIGLVAFNSAWRCIESKKDRGNLLFPVYLVQEAFALLKDCKIVICNQHHNISDYKDFVAQDIEDLINEKSHIFFTGHYHKASINTNHDSEIGLLHLSAPAAFNRGDKESKYGYTILDLDEESFEGNLYLYNYIDREFIQSKITPVAVPMSESKREANDFRKLLRKHYNQVLQQADELFVSGDSGDFLKLFKNPIIKNKSVQEIIATQKEGKSFSLTDILRDCKSSIIFGYNKRGKTSLLRWIQLESIKECINKKVIPFYVDYKIWKCKKLELKKELKNYLELSTRKNEELFNEYSLLLLVDDLNPADTNFTEKLKNELSQFPSCRFIATSAESMSKQCFLINFMGEDAGKYYIHDITYKEVHQLTISWPNISNEKKKQVEEKIVQIFTQMHIPLNYWTTSLFLWIFEKTDEHNIHNNFDLIQLYIDELLDKKNYILNPDYKVSYDDLKSYLAALAEEILKSEYSLTETELTTFTETYRNAHKKITDTSWDMITYLLKKAILIKTEDRYTIRLKGVFEFFLAYRMKDDEDFKRKILNYKYYFLSFGNELELYAGFCKDDEKTITHVFNSAEKALFPLTSKKDYTELDSRLNNKLQITNTDFKCTGNLLDRLAATPDDEEQYDELLPATSTPIDEIEVKPKILYDNIDITTGSVERILFVLARIFRNSNACDMKNLTDKMFNYILNGSCNLGFMLVKDSKSFENVDEKNADSLVKLVSNFMPIIVETFFYDAICQQNLVRVFKTKLEELLKAPENNQMRIFMLIYIFVDLDIKEYFPLISKGLEVITNKVLRFAMLNKNILLTMKHYENPEIINKLKIQRNDLILEFKEMNTLNKELDTRLLHKQNKEQQIKLSTEKDYLN